MAINRTPPKCPKCGADYDALHAQYTANFVGDTFIMWDTQNHKCKWIGSSGGVLSSYEERLENIVVKIKDLTIIEGICLLKEHIPRFDNENDA
jgi:hypothetical protein